MARVIYVKAARASKRERSCRKCGKKIKAGDAYYWWKNRAPGMRSGVMKIQCADHPPTMADRTPGRRGQLYSLQEDIESQVGEWIVSDATTPDGLLEIAQTAAEGVRELAEELREGAENIESGFGHETFQSQEMNEKADELESVADDLENPDIPSEPDEPEDDDEDAQESYEDELASWREEAGSVITDRLSEAEV